jgi:hypothetical protein
LEQATGEQAFADGALEAVEVGRFAQGELVVVVGDDFVEFVLDARVGRGEAAEGGEGFGSLDKGRGLSVGWVVEERDRGGKVPVRVCFV